MTKLREKEKVFKGEVKVLKNKVKTAEMKLKRVEKKNGKKTLEKEV
jgi:hypothetical protein